MKTVATLAGASLLLSVVAIVSPMKATDGDTELRLELARLKQSEEKRNADFIRLAAILDLGVREGARGKVWAELDPTSTGYAKADSNTGFFLVSCKKVEPYLNGHRVALAIGNPMGIRFNRFDVSPRRN